MSTRVLAACASLASLALAASACAPEDTTGYTLNIIGTHDAKLSLKPEEVPTRLLLSCFVEDTSILDSKPYPASSSQQLEYIRGRVAQIGINTDPRLEGKRRIWVRAVRDDNTKALAEAAVLLDLPKEGTRPKVDLQLLWRGPSGEGLPDVDSDGVPDVIDNCPAMPNPEQKKCPTQSGPMMNSDTAAESFVPRDAAHSDSGADARASLDMGVF